MTAATIAPARARLGFAFWSFIAFMLALTALFVVLGVWQVDRLGWKEGLIAEVDQRLHLPPVPLPSVAEWSSLDTEAQQYRPVSVTGRYLADKTILVFISLSEPRGKFEGPGYWVMTPFVTDDGGTLFVNRGFIPQASAPQFAAGQGVSSAQQTVSGVALAAEAIGSFTPAPDTAHHIEWVRDPVRLATMAGIIGPLLPMTIDAPAGAPGSLPQGGETEVDFPNNHLGYAMTWFGFAILTPCLLAAWIWRQLRPAVPKPAP